MDYLGYWVISRLPLRPRRLRRRILGSPLWLGLRGAVGRGVVKCTHQLPLIKPPLSHSCGYFAVSLPTLVTSTVYLKLINWLIRFVESVH
jgi:hypothetical protein